MNYDKYLKKTYEIALSSNDPSTQNGALLFDPTTNNVLVSAANNFPKGVIETPERWLRPKKYLFVEHAERAVILKAASEGIKTKGLIMVCFWSACADCARAIVGSGVKILVRHKIDPDTSSKTWFDSILAGDEIMIEGGVDIVEVSPVAGFKIRRDGVVKDTSEL